MPALDRGRMFAELRQAQAQRREQERAALTGVNSTWRFYDQPMRGWVYRTPDDVSLQRGITFTILPDGRRLRVPRMQKIYRDNTDNDEHDDEYGSAMMKMLADIIGGGKSSSNNRKRGPQIGPHRQGKDSKGDPARHQIEHHDDPPGLDNVVLPRQVAFN